LHERAPLSPEKYIGSRRSRVSYWFRNDNRLPQERLAAASYVIVGMITLLLLVSGNRRSLIRQVWRDGGAQSVR
jgi:hypothetical protein